MQSKRADAPQLRKNFALIAFAATLIATLAAENLRAESILGDDEDSPSSLSDLAREAGSRAALLGQCGVDARPVMLAFERRLEAAGVSAAAKSELRQGFQSARASAATALVRSAANECRGPYGLLREIIRDLNQPLS